MKKDYEFLNQINFPSDLKKIPEKNLQKVVKKLQKQILKKIKKNQFTLL